MDGLHIILAADGNHTVSVTLSEDWEGELQQALAVLDRIAKKETAPNCPEHHKPMVQATGKYGPFWSCRQKLEDGKYCGKTAKK
jgi:hypothetical protein